MDSDDTKKIKRAKPFKPFQAIKVYGKLFLRNLHKKKAVKEDLTRVNRFTLVMKRIQKSPDYTPSDDPKEPYGRFKNRHIIGEFTTINEGIYLGIKNQEAIVINEKYQLLEKVYKDLISHLEKNYHKDLHSIPEEKIISVLIQTVEDTLTYVSEEEINEKLVHENADKDQKVALDIYVKYHVGTDRHQVLLAAYLIEHLLRDHILKGKIYIDGFCGKNHDRGEKLLFSSAGGNFYVFSPS